LFDLFLDLSKTFCSFCSVESKRERKRQINFAKQVFVFSEKKPLFCFSSVRREGLTDGLQSESQNPFGHQHLIPLFTNVESWWKSKSRKKEKKIHYFSLKSH
jgi:hypothetical protein